MRKLAVLISVLALAAFGFAACGDDDDDDGGETTAATTTEETTGGGGGGGGAVEVSSSEGIAYDQSSLATKPGTVTIEFTNDAGIDHDVVIEDAQGNEVARTDVIDSGTTSTEADLDPGEYVFFCSVDGHRDAGMEGPLTAQ
ncbi:MAG TPA: plastocyanin/azurin family copper-binding protein [Solirubrobacterales bacterium]|jgi:plastocyanin|nr:plastocyanin/azurin family copper-binding protein [Solirubrobacterales bacterium]